MFMLQRVNVLDLAGSLNPSAPSSDSVDPTYLAADNVS
ncbi:hypothetical protein SAMN05880566_12725 [Janthinobacterium sp. TND4EL3]|nr:hypothetical protein SAMN05880566_12725 [Janthinobacterium sp. TND4EL3]